MTKTDNKKESQALTPLQISKYQRSHLMLVLCNSQRGQENQFSAWNINFLNKKIAEYNTVLNSKLLEKHDTDVTEGAYQNIPYQYLTIIELSIDGAQQAQGLADEIMRWHLEEPSADTPALWLYYPASEKVGRPASINHSMLTLAFANALPGTDSEFREWYCTRHIRHALNVPQIVSGQCFERTCYQPTGSTPIEYSMIAIYEQEGTPEEMIESFHKLPEELLDFPSLDLVKFAEWVYRPVSANSSKE